MAAAKEAARKLVVAVKRSADEELQRAGRHFKGEMCEDIATLATCTVSSTAFVRMQVLMSATNGWFSVTEAEAEKRQDLEAALQKDLEARLDAQRQQLERQRQQDAAAAGDQSRERAERAAEERAIRER